MLTLQAKVSGLYELRRKFHRATQVMTDGKAFREEIIKRILKEIDLNFESEGKRFTNKQWESLEETWTVRDRIKKYKVNGHHPILQRTGKLRESIYGDFNKRTPEFGSKSVYAGTHNYGAPNPISNRRAIPKRRFLPTEAQTQYFAELSTKVYLNKLFSDFSEWTKLNEG